MHDFLFDKHCPCFVCREYYSGVEQDRIADQAKEGDYVDEEE